jgi:hypothetical protein
VDTRGPLSAWTTWFAVAVELESGEVRYFISYGRIQAATDPKPLERIVLRHAGGCSLGETPVRARLCAHLREAAGEPYSYEAIFAFARDAIPPGRGYKKWRKRIAKGMRRGKHLYFLVK